MSLAAALLHQLDILLKILHTLLPATGASLRKGKPAEMQGRKVIGLQ